MASEKELIDRITSDKRWMTGFCSDRNPNTDKIMQKIKLVQDALTTLNSMYGNKPNVQQFAAEAKKEVDAASKFVEEQTRKEAIEKLKSPIESSMRWLMDACDKKNVPQTSKYLTQVKPQIAELESKFGDDSEVAKFLQGINQKVEDAEKALASATRSEDIAKLKSPIESSMRWLTDACDKKNVPQTSKYLTQVKPQIAELESKFGDDSEVAKFLQGINQKVEDAEKALASATRSEDIAKLKSPIESSMRWLTDACEKKNIPQVSKYLEQIKPQIAALESKFGDDSDVAKFLQGIKQKVEDAEKALGSATRSEDIAKLKSPIESSMRWLTDACEKKNIPQVSKYLEQIKPQIAALESKFGDDSDVAKFLQGIKQKVEDAEKALGGAVADEKIKSISSQAQSTARWLQDAFDKGNVNGCVTHLQKLKPMLEELATLLENPAAKRAYDPLKQTYDNIDGQVEALKAQQTATELAQPVANTQRQMLDAVDRRDVDGAVRYRQKLEEHLTALRPYVSAVQSAARMVQDAEKALARVDSELGDLVAEKETGELLPPLEKSLAALQEALDRRDAEAVLRLKQELTKLETPLRTRYAAHARVAPVLTRSDDLCGRIEAEIGEILFERELTAALSVVDSAAPLLETALKNKSPDEVQTYQRALVEAVQPLRARAGKPKADALVQRVDSLTQRVSNELGPLLAQLEVDDAVSVLRGPLQQLQEAVQQNNVSLTRWARRRLISTALPLRLAKEPPASAAAAVAARQQLLESVDAAVRSADDQMGDAVAARHAAQLKSLVDTYCDTARLASTQGEKNVLSALLKRLEATVYPLRVLYPNRTAAASLVQAAEKCISDCGGLLVNDVTRDSAQKVQQKLEPLWAKVAEFAAKRDLPSQVAALQKVSQEAAAARKSWLWVPAVRQLLLDIDAAYVRMFGELAADVDLQESSERLPTFEVSLKLNTEIQALINAINESHKDINKTLVELAASYVCRDLAGADMSKRINMFMGLESGLNDLSRPADRLQQEVASVLSRLRRLDEAGTANTPMQKLLEAPSDKLPSAYAGVVSTSQEAHERVKAWMQDQASWWQPRWRYAVYNGGARHDLDLVEKELADTAKILANEARQNNCSSTHYTLGLQRSRQHTHSIWDLCNALLAMVRKVEEYLQSAESEVGANDAPESQQHRVRAQRLKKRTELLMFQQHDAWVEFLALNGELKTAESFVTACEKSFPNDPRTKDLGAKFNEIKARREAASADLKRRTAQLEQQLADGSAAISAQYEAFVQSKKPTPKPLSAQAVLRDLESYRDTYMVVPKGLASFRAGDQRVAIEGEEWSLSLDNDLHLAQLIACLREDAYDHWAQIKDSVHRCYRLPPTPKDGNHGLNQHHSVGLMSGNINWDASDIELIGCVKGKFTEEQVKSKRQNGVEVFYAMLVHYPVLQIEGFRCKHMTAFIGDGKPYKAPNRVIENVTHSSPADPQALVPTDVVPPPYWTGKPLGTHQLTTPGGPPTAAKALSSAALPLPAPKGAATKLPVNLPPPAVAKGSRDSAGAAPPSPNATRDLPAPAPKLPSPVAPPATAAKLPATPPAGVATAKLPAPVAAMKGLPPPPAGGSPKAPVAAAGSATAAAVASLKPSSSGSVSPRGESGGVATPPPGSPSAGLMKPIAKPAVGKLPVAATPPPVSSTPPPVPPTASAPSITASVSAPPSPSISASVTVPGAREALLEERKKLEQEILEKQKRLAEVVKLLAVPK